MTLEKMTDKEIEQKVTENLMLAGRVVGKNYPYIVKADSYAKQHSQYETKYKASMEILKSIHTVSRLIKG